MEETTKTISVITPHDSEQSEEVDGDDVAAAVASQFAKEDVDETADDDDEVESVPSIAEVILKPEGDDL